MRVVGVDGCPGGWLAVAYETDDGSLVPRVHRSFADLLAAEPDAACVAIDIPIGLVEGESRACDRDARKALGPRRSSVFPAPDPRLLDATTYAEANQRARILTGAGVSAQAFGIYPKVRDVNRAMTSALQRRVVEVHPEVCFWALAGRTPMAFPKRTPEGFAERRALLVAALGDAVPPRDAARTVARPAAPDDVLDAIAAAWTARRHAEGRSGRLPDDPPLDTRGLRMEMVY